MIPLNGHPFISKFILAIFGCKQESLPINYMGVLLDKGRLSRRECFLLIDRVERKLDSWKAHYLSMGGRLILLNTVLSSLPHYLMPITIFPKWV